MGGTGWRHGRSNGKGLETNQGAINPAGVWSSLVARPRAAWGLLAHSEHAASMHRGVREIKISFEEGLQSLKSIRNDASLKKKQKTQHKRTRWRLVKVFLLL